MKNKTKKTRLSLAIAASISLTVLPGTASALLVTLTWDGAFTMLDPDGYALGHGSMANPDLVYQTPISGTMTYDTSNGIGTSTVDAFDFGEDQLIFGPITMEAISGPLVLGNMLFDWSGNNNIPMSIVWDISGLLDAVANTPGGLAASDVISGDKVIRGGTQIYTIAGSAVPASDGTYVNPTIGYLQLGPTPIATTTFNTTNATGCTFADCTGSNPSGTLPQITDTVLNVPKSFAGSVLGIGGSPMQDGPFISNSINLDIGNGNSLHIVSVESSPTLVPVPPAIWLLGSGLAGLVGITRRKRQPSTD